MERQGTDSLENSLARSGRLPGGPMQMTGSSNRAKYRRSSKVGGWKLRRTPIWRIALYLVLAWIVVSCVVFAVLYQQQISTSIGNQSVGDEEKKSEIGSTKRAGGHSPVDPASEQKIERMSAEVKHLEQSLYLKESDTKQLQADLERVQRKLDEAVANQRRVQSENERLRRQVAVESEIAKLRAAYEEITNLKHVLKQLGRHDAIAKLEASDKLTPLPVATEPPPTVAKTTREPTSVPLRNQRPAVPSPTIETSKPIPPVPGAPVPRPKRTSPPLGNLRPTPPPNTRTPPVYEKSVLAPAIGPQKPKFPPIKTTVTKQHQLPSSSEQELAKKTKGRGAIFLQVGSMKNWMDIESCIQNVAGARFPLGGQKAVLKSLDVFVAFADGYSNGPEVRHGVERSLEKISGIDKLHFATFPNRGGDAGLFLNQLQQEQAIRNGGEYINGTLIGGEDLSLLASADTYGYILKIHTKSDWTWRERMIQSMCGSTPQVRSIIKGLDRDLGLGMVAPLGTALEASDTTDAVFYSLDIKPEESLWGSFGSESNLLIEKEFIEKKFGSSVTLPVGERLSIVAGTYFWARYLYLRPKLLGGVATELTNNMTLGYVKGSDRKMEHKIERYLSAAVRAQGKNIAEVPPAVKPMVTVLPHYSSSSDQLSSATAKSKVEDEQQSEWTVLKALKKNSPVAYSKLQIPLEHNNGGLGEYNLLEKATRIRMGKLAMEAGVHGLNFNHYWYCGKGAPSKHVTLNRVVDEMAFGDGEPLGMTFMLTWDNDPSTGSPPSSLSSKKNFELIKQEPYPYGQSQENWEEHLKYLVKYFNSSRYQKIDGRPVFGIRNPGHIRWKNAYNPMIKLWQKLLKTQYGFPKGLHLAIGTGPGGDTERGWQNTRWILHRSYSEEFPVEATMPVWPEVCSAIGAPWIGQRPGTSPSPSQPCPQMMPATRMESTENLGPRQFWGATTGYNPLLRQGKLMDGTPFPSLLGEGGTGSAMFDPESTVVRLNPEVFEEALAKSFQSMGRYRNWKVDLNLFFINSWNDWTGQAVLEPSKKYLDGFLRALARAINNVELSYVM